VSWASPTPHRQPESLNGNLSVLSGSQCWHCVLVSAPSCAFLSEALVLLLRYHVESNNTDRDAINDFRFCGNERSLAVSVVCPGCAYTKTPRHRARSRSKRADCRVAASCPIRSMPRLRPRWQGAGLPPRLPIATLKPSAHSPARVLWRATTAPHAFDSASSSVKPRAPHRSSGVALGSSATSTWQSTSPALSSPAVVRGGPPRPRTHTTVTRPEPIRRPGRQVGRRVGEPMRQQMQRRAGGTDAAAFHSPSSRYVR
jgi:hypothetical protein